MDAWTAIAAFAASTSRIQVGPQVSPLSFHHPSHLAKMAGTVDLISRGRLLLQLGAAWNAEEHHAYGFPWEQRFTPRYERMIEGVEVIKKLWTEERPVSYRGKHFNLDGALFWPKPVQKPHHPPIWFGGMGKKVRQAVTRYGDGWCPAMLHHAGVGFQYYTEGLGDIRQMVQAQGRDASKIVPGIVYPTAIDEDRGKAAEKVAILRHRADFAHLSAKEMRERGMVLWGNPDECTRSMEDYIKAGVRYFTFSFIPVADTDSVMQGIELYATKVRPRLSPV